MGRRSLTNERVVTVGILVPAVGADVVDILVDPTNRSVGERDEDAAGVIARRGNNPARGVVGRRDRARGVRGQDRRDPTRRTARRRRRKSRRSPV